MPVLPAVRQPLRPQPSGTSSSGPDPHLALEPQWIHPPSAPSPTWHRPFTLRGSNRHYQEPSAPNNPANELPALRDQSSFLPLPILQSVEGLSYPFSSCWWEIQTIATDHTACSARRNGLRGYPQRRSPISRSSTSTYTLARPNRHIRLTRPLCGLAALAKCRARPARLFILHGCPARLGRLARFASIATTRHDPLRRSPGYCGLLADRPDGNQWQHWPTEPDAAHQKLNVDSTRHAQRPSPLELRPQEDTPVAQRQHTSWRRKE